MGKAKTSLADAIRAAVPPAPSRSKPWWTRIDAGTLEEIQAVKADWKAGRLPGSKRAVATAIAAELNARKISDIGIQGVAAWLVHG